MAKMGVDSEAMRDQAKRLRDIAESLEDITNDITKEVVGLELTWKGDAARAFEDSFATYSKNYTVIYNTLMEYATFLDKAAKIYDEVETANKA